MVSGISDSVSQAIGSPPKGHGVLGQLIADPRPRRYRDVTRAPQFEGFPKHHPKMHSFLGVPILGPDGIMGTLYFANKIGADEFGDEDEAVAVMFAANAAVAVRNARLDEESIMLLSELQNLQRTRDRFYAMVNHELRNALTAVHGWSELLLRKAGTDPPRPVAETMESASYALQLLHDLLDLSRLDAEMLDLDVTRADGRKMAEEAWSTIEPTASPERVHILITGREGHIGMTTDPKRVRQILINLLSNAVRHSPPDSTITVQVAASGNEVRYDVIDQGEGIGPDELAIIFDAYARASTRTGGGTGLGLTLSKRLARMLGGDLSVTSTLGEGAHFTLTVARYLDSS